MTPNNNNRLATVELREAFFIALYKSSFPAVARYVARMGGSLEEAQDVFQDALVVYYEKVISMQADAVVNEKAYLLGIAQKLWFRQYKTNRQSSRLEDDFDTEAETDEQLSAGKLMHYLETAGKKCMQLLKACYYDHLPVEKVAKVFGYSSSHSTAVAKYKCLEKVRENVKQNSLSYADFIE